MRIQHNIEAMNANRQLNSTGRTLARSARNLSSGYKINVAADDAAGLSISEKMRRQVRGLNKGIENTEDGVSLCQVADGALAEVHDMLQRMNELAVQSANGTNSASDRVSINDEVSALVQEIDRIGKTTRFNEHYVFEGESLKKKDRIGVANQPTIVGKFFQVVGKNNTSKTPHMEEPIPVATMKTYKTTSTIGGTFDFVSVHADFAELIDKKKNIKALAGCSVYVNCCTNCCAAEIDFVDEEGITSTKGNIKIGIKKAGGKYYDSANEFVNAILDALIPATKDSPHVEFACDPNGTTLYLYDIDNKAWDPNNKAQAIFCDPVAQWQKPQDTSPVASKNYSLWIQSGCDAGDGMVMKVGPMNSEVLAIDEMDVLSEDHADNAIEQIGAAIRKISEQRSRIGAYQNRLEHTIANEENIVENTTAAESQIRDTDMAEEMVRYSNKNILLQAGQAMLSQANQSRQGILSLLSA